MADGDEEPLVQDTTAEIVFDVNPSSGRPSSYSPTLTPPVLLHHQLIPATLIWVLQLSSRQNSRVGRADSLVSPQAHRRTRPRAVVMTPRSHLGAGEGFHDTSFLDLVDGMSSVSSSSRAPSSSMEGVVRKDGERSAVNVAGVGLREEDDTEDRERERGAGGREGEGRCTSRISASSPQAQDAVRAVSRRWTNRRRGAWWLWSDSMCSNNRVDERWMMTAREAYA
jgi:hypothetical protein